MKENKRFRNIYSEEIRKIIQNISDGTNETKNSLVLQKYRNRKIQMILISIDNFQAINRISRQNS